MGNPPPSNFWSTPPDQAAASSRSCSTGKGSTTVAPSFSASAFWAGQAATTMTSTSGQSARMMAVAQLPSAPPP